MGGGMGGEEEGEKRGGRVEGSEGERGRVEEEQEGEGVKGGRGEGEGS